MASDDLGHISKDSYLSGVKTWPEKFVYMLCCVSVSLTRLQNETCNYLENGFITFLKLQHIILLFLLSWNGTWNQPDFCVKMILYSCKIF